MVEDLEAAAGMPIADLAVLTKKWLRKGWARRMKMRIVPAPRSTCAICRSSAR